MYVCTVPYDITLIWFQRLRILSLSSFTLLGSISRLLPWSLPSLKHTNYVFSSMLCAQWCGSWTFWYESGFADPYHWVMDPDPALYVSSWLRMVQKHTDPTDPDLQHWLRHQDSGSQDPRLRDFLLVSDFLLGSHNNYHNICTHKNIPI